MSNQQLPKVVQIFDIRKQETKQGTKGKVVFNADVEVFYKGTKVDLGQYKGGFLKKTEEVIENLDYAVEKFGLPSEVAEKKKAFMEDKDVTSVFEVNTQKKEK